MPVSPIRPRERFGRVTRLTLAAAALAGAAWSTDPATPAFGQAPSIEELMVAGPLGDHVQGRADAPVTIIEYASLTCPHCANFHVNVYPILKSRYIDAGKVRYLLREYPRDTVDAAAFVLARCAGHEKYFALIDTLFRQQDKWAFAPKPREPLAVIARQAGFDEASFKACLDNRQLLDGIYWVRRRGEEKLGVSATPSFFVNGTMQIGALSAEQLEELIAWHLKR